MVRRAAIPPHERLLGEGGSRMVCVGEIGTDGRIQPVPTKRGYSDEFPTTRKKRVYFMLDKIPPALWIRVKAKAKREGVSLRSLILRWCQEWVER